jgi:hypothetical protein
MRVLTLIEDADEIARYLAHTGEATAQERARGPPVWAA